MKLLFKKIASFILNFLNIILNPFYCLITFVPYKQKDKELDFYQSKFVKFGRNKFVILLFSAILTTLIILAIYHKELLGV